MGVEPHPKQEQWLNTRARVKVACCGRQWGKSFAEGVDLLWYAATHPESSQFVFAPTSDQSRIIMRYAEKLIRASRIPDALTKTLHAPYPSLEFSNGAVIHARTVGDTGAGVRGNTADRVILDEAAFIPLTVIDHVIGPLLATRTDGQLILISTPWGKNHFFDAWQRGQLRVDGHISFQYPSSSSPYISRAYLAQQRAQMTELAFAVEYGAEFRDDQNSVFPYEHIQRAIDETITPDPVPGHRYVVGFDPAKWHDRSGVVVLDVTTKPWRVVCVLDISGREYLAQAAQIKRVCGEYANASVLIDATSHDQMLEQLIADGVRAEGLKWTNEVKGEVINGLAIALEKQDILLPRHPDLIREMTHYRAELTPAGNVKLGAPTGTDHYDDLVSALAMAVHLAKTGEGLPYAWLRNDPEFRASVLDTPAESDPERIARRRTAQGL